MCDRVAWRRAWNSEAWSWPLVLPLGPGLNRDRETAREVCMPLQNTGGGVRSTALVRWHVICNSAPWEKGVPNGGAVWAGLGGWPGQGRTAHGTCRSLVTVTVTPGDAVQLALDVA